MNYLIIILRLIHILGGVFWVGAALMMTYYVGPSVSATAEAGQKFIQHMMGSTNLQKVMASSSGASLLAGIFLFADKPPEWHTSSAGIGFGIGAAFAIVGFVLGILIGRGMKSAAQLGAQIKGQPTADQLGQIQTLQKRTTSFSNINAIMLILAVVFMSTARYFTF